MNFALQAPEDWTQAPLGLVLTYTRRMYGLKQRELAGKAGLQPAQLCRMEGASVEPKLSSWRQAFAALDCGLLVLPRPAAAFDVTRERAFKELSAELRRTLGST